MRFKTRCVLVGVILILLCGCSQRSAKLQRSVVPPDKTLFETGSDYLYKSQYIRARLAFQTLISTYPDSEMTPLSYFAMADSFYEEGGTENLLQAEDQYKNFIIFYPKHPKAPDAQMKVISANMKMMRAPDRDQQFSHRALQEIKDFMQRFPDSDYVPIVRRFKVEVEENLAAGDLGVGRFYENRGNYAGAVGRYKGIVDEYKEYSRLDEVYFRSGNISEELAKRARENAGDEAAKYIEGALDEAAKFYEKIVVGYPFSEFYDEAKARLKAMGKSVPEVDAKIAASNQSRLKPAEGFSPLKPIIDFGKALGFVGLPDRYEEAQKSLEEAKVKRAAAGKTGDEGLTEDDIQIETIIRKSASGETEDTTTLGGGTGSVPQGNEDTKKEPREN
jgi:outer membrane assembly lipoprotein YfiO